MKKRLSIFDSAKPLIKGEAEELPALPKSLIERGVYADDGADFQGYKCPVKGKHKTSKLPRKSGSSAEP